MATTLGNFLSGAGIPSNGDGSDGDHYRNTSNQDLWFKSSGLWSLIGNLYNGIPDGVGTVIQDGSGNPSNLNGENGYYYRDRDNQNFWFKVEGIWHLLCRLGGTAEGGGGCGPADLRTVVNTRTTAAWTVIADEVTPQGKHIVSVVHSGACSCELETPTILGAEPGDKLSIMQGGAGTLTITGGAGAALIGNAVFVAQYEVKTAIALDGTTWLLAGAQ